MRHDIDYTVEWGAMERKRMREARNERLAIIALHLAVVFLLYVLTTY
jgi:hypothetical protein